MLKRYIGDRRFYRSVMAVAVPIMIQNFITNFVGMLDNIMVGQVGTAEMSGVAIVNQILFVFYLCLFGAASGAGIFTAQFFGNSDHEGVRHTFRYKILAGVVITAVGTAIFLLFGSNLISFFLKGDGEAGEAERYLSFGREYMGIMLAGLLPFAVTSAYTSTLRECGQTVVPMVAGIVAVLVNLLLNWVLIFGNLGAPALGISGAAIATVISRFAELAVCAGWTHTHSDKAPFIKGAYRSFAIPKELTVKITKKSLPLMANEALWSVGITTLNWCYSLRSLDVVGAVNIATTLTNTMSVSLIAMGNAVGIIIGQKLGARKPESEVLDATRKLAFFSVAFTAVFAIAQAALSGVFPGAYNTTAAIRSLASSMILVHAACMPARAFTNASYFTIRSGGQALVTFLFDSCFVWAAMVPTAFLLSKFSSVSVIFLFAIVEGLEFLKCILGYVMLRSKRWMKTIIN